MTRSVLFLSLLLTLALLSPFVVPASSKADSVSDIQAQIDDINKERDALNAEIAGYQKQLNALGAQHQTLQSAISTIDVSRSKTSAQIADIQKKIAAANLKLSQLSIQINDKQESIALDQAAVAQALRAIDSSDDTSLIESVFSSTSVAEAWVAADNLTSLNVALGEHAAALGEAKKVLGEEQNQVSDTKTELSSANDDLAGQKRALDAQKAAKANLLAQTQSSEASYQALIAQKKAQEAAFEAQLFQLASQLKSVGKESVTAAGKGVLAWPLTNIVITQQFGKTSDSGRLYSSGTHNGVDFGAPVGTPVHAALSGTVIATNFVTAKQDAAIGYCQYGSWILIQHANGLDTLYAHLSEVDVKKGQTVTTGQTIGLSGQTGYATGPHLHVSVFVAAAVTLQTYTCKTGYTVPIPNANPSDYLDPLAYF
jgi:murein DD-endopeptidase MepM/ murein hydrolase activator NlpD